jgi:hypothetical protein
MERRRDCRGSLPEERMDSEHTHEERIQRDLQVLGQEAMPEVPEREPDIRSGTTSPQSPHREAEDRGGADHGLRGRDGPGDKMFQLQRLRTHRQELSAETEVPQMRQGGPQTQGVQGGEIRMRELQADRAQSLRQEVPHDEEGTRAEDRPNREVLNAQGRRDKIKVFHANLGRGREATEPLQRMAEEEKVDVVLIQESYCYMPAWAGWSKYGGGRSDKIATMVRTGRRSIE